MFADLVAQLMEIVNVRDVKGKRVVPNAMELAHYGDTLEGVWWYRLYDGRLEYSKDATTHQDFDRFTAPENSRGWIRGRVFNWGKLPERHFIVIYGEDFPNGRIPGRVVNDLYKKISSQSGFEIDGIVDEQGYDLVEGRK